LTLGDFTAIFRRQLKLRAIRTQHSRLHPTGRVSAHGSISGQRGKDRICAFCRLEAACQRQTLFPRLGATRCRLSLLPHRVSAMVARYAQLGAIPRRAGLANEDGIACPPLCRQQPGLAATASRDGCACACCSCRHWQSAVMSPALRLRQTLVPVMPRRHSFVVRLAHQSCRRMAPRRHLSSIRSRAHPTHAAAARQFSRGLRTCCRAWSRRPPGSPVTAALASRPELF
jgi:hypothetical protein